MGGAWLMKIKYIGDLYKVIVKSDIQLKYTYVENEPLTITVILSSPSWYFLDVQSRSRTAYLPNSA